MAVNTKPIFTGKSAIGTATIAGGGTSATKIFPSSPATSPEGWYVQKVRARLTTATSTVATVLRISLSSDGSTFYLLDEISIPITTISNTAFSTTFELAINFALPSNFSLYAKYDTSPGASTVTDITVFGGSYTAQ